MQEQECGLPGSAEAVERPGFRQASMEHEAIFWFTDARAKTLFCALDPEVSEELNPRSHAECTLEDPRTLVLKVRARDIPALRASLNMWLRLVNVADEMQAFAPRETEERS
ncbi:MAG: KEOPS complex subunit Pcc1 [Methanolinea sp.]|nr:KEOPS complex subunit Pcc1 [Methanolinea sp.]